MHISKVASVVLADPDTVDQLSNSALFFRLNWVGGRIDLTPPRLMFRANRLNLITQKLVGSHPIHNDFGVDIDMLESIELRTWLGIRIIELRSQNNEFVVLVRCWQPAELAATIIEHQQQ